MIYLVTYDLYGVSDVTRESVEEYLKNLKSCKILTTTWIIETALTKNNIIDKIRSIAGQSGSAFVFVVDIENYNYNFFLREIKADCLNDKFGVY